MSDSEDGDGVRLSQRNSHREDGGIDYPALENDDEIDTSSTTLDVAEVPDQDELAQNGFIKLNTHDTSFVEGHIPSIEQFAADLQIAIDAAWPTRHRSGYNEAHVLLISWEDDNLGVEQEIRRLGHVFSNLYRFDVQEFRIPKKTPGKATTSKISSFLEKDEVGTLLIVYYAGHARLSHQANEPPIWAATDKPGSPTLPSGGVQQLLEEAESDVLLLYDSCHSSHPAINVSGQGVTEVIAACGFETQAPAVGPHSFTNALIQELEEAFNGAPISVAELHGRIIGSLKNWKPGLLRNPDGSVWTDANGRPRRECHKRRTPVHCFLTNETPYRSIMLAPQPSNLSHAAVATMEIESMRSLHTSSSSAQFSQSGSSSILSPSSTVPTTISDVSKPAQNLEVLLAVRLEDDYFLEDDDEENENKLRKWCEWLKAMPNGAQNVSIQGLYKSCSALVLMSMPIMLWDLLPNNGAYSFIGFVASDNLAPGSWPLLDDKREDNKKLEHKVQKLEEKLRLMKRGNGENYRSRYEEVVADNEALRLEAPRRLDLPETERFPGLEKTESEVTITSMAEAPIILKDAVGRTLTLPFHLCKTWAGVEKLINEAFLYIDIIGPHVQAGHYDLLSPTGTLIIPSTWTYLIQPGQKISMHMWPMPGIASKYRTPSTPPIPILQPIPRRNHRRSPVRSRSPSPLKRHRYGSNRSTGSMRSTGSGYSVDSGFGDSSYGDNGDEIKNNTLWNVDLRPGVAKIRSSVSPAPLQPVDLARYHHDQIHSRGRAGSEEPPLQSEDLENRKLSELKEMRDRITRGLRMKADAGELREPRESYPVQTRDEDYF